MTRSPLTTPANNFAGIWGNIYRMSATVNCDRIFRVRTNRRIGCEVNPPMCPMSEPFADGWICCVDSRFSPKLYRRFHLAQLDPLISEIISGNADSFGGATR